MKHLSILTISTALILFAGLQLKQSSHVYTNSKSIKQEITAAAQQTKVKSDSLIVSEGTKATATVAKKMENGTVQVIGHFIKSIF